MTTSRKLWPTTATKKVGQKYRYTTLPALIVKKGWQKCAAMRDPRTRDRVRATDEAADEMIDEAADEAADKAADAATEVEADGDADGDAAGAADKA